MKMPAKYQIGNRVIWAMAAPLLVLVTLTPVANRAAGVLAEFAG